MISSHRGVVVTATTLMVLLLAPSPLAATNSSATHLEWCNTEWGYSSASDSCSVDSMAVTGTYVPSNPRAPVLPCCLLKAKCKVPGDPYASVTSAAYNASETSQTYDGKMEKLSNLTNCTGVLINGTCSAGYAVENSPNTLYNGVAGDHFCPQS